MLLLVLDLGGNLSSTSEALGKVFKSFFYYFFNSELDGIVNILLARVMEGGLFT